VKSSYKTLVVLPAALDHTSQRVGKPLLEVAVGLKDVWHEEMHQWPQLHEAVLQWRPGQQQPTLTVEVEQRLPALRLEVLYILSLFVSYNTDTVNWHCDDCCLVQSSAVMSKKVKAEYSSPWEPYLRELLGITCHMGSQCYLPPDTSERAPP